MTAPPPDWEAEGLLDALEGDTRAARVRLLDALHAEGTALPELRTAVREGRLAALPAEHLFGGPLRFSAREASRINGLPLEMVLAVRRANGLPIADPDAIELSRLDVDAGKTAGLAAASDITLPQIEATARVLGHALRQLAGQLGAIIFERAYAPGLAEDELAARFAAEVERFEPLMDDVVHGSLRLHLREAIRDVATELTELEPVDGLPGAREMAIAFADLVGFTRMGEELPPEDLERVAQRLSQLAAEAADPPVRFVKTIGDAVMLVAPDPGSIVRAGLELVALADAEGTAFPLIRVGIASGPAVSRSGDWYGRPVNLASRLTALARAHAVLVSGQVRDAAHEDPRLRFSDAGVRRVRGIREPVHTYRARRA